MKLYKRSIYRSKFYKDSLLVFIGDVEGSKNDGWFMDLTDGRLTRDAKVDQIDTGKMLTENMFWMLEAIMFNYDPEKKSE